MSVQYAQMIQAAHDMMEINPRLLTVTLQGVNGKRLVLSRKLVRMKIMEAVETIQREVYGNRLTGIDAHGLPIWEPID